MGKHFVEIGEIERVTLDFLEKGDIRSALDSYSFLMDAFPFEAVFYERYIDFLLDDAVLSELSFSAFTEAVSCCDNAIKNVGDEKKVLFFTKKAALYLVMIQDNDQWRKEQRTEILRFMQHSLTLFPDNYLLLQCAMTFYRLSGDIAKYDNCLDHSIKICPGDVMLALEKATNFELDGKINAAINALENWIKQNPDSSEKDTAYLKISLLYKSIHNYQKANIYQGYLNLE